MTSNLDERLQTIAHDLEAASPPVTIEEIVNRRPMAQVVLKSSEPPVTSRHRLGFAAAAIMLIGTVISLIGLTYRHNGTIDSADTATITASPQDAGSPSPTTIGSSTAGPADELRTILSDGHDSDRPRYVRIWNRTESESSTEILLSEQWFEPSGVAVGGTEFLVDADEGLGGWLNVDRVLDLSTMFREDGGDRDLGFPERQLPTTANDLAAVLTNPNAAGKESPDVFMTVSTGPGIDSSYLPATANSARELTRLLPTIMDPAVRRAAYEVAASLHDARVLPATPDLLGRASSAVTIPFAIVEPVSEAEVGHLEVTFWFDHETYAPHQIEWRLTEGELGDSGTSLFIDTTVIVEAGDVAQIPQVNTADEEPTAPASTVTTTEPAND